MAHAWKACWVQALGGSNPPSSATGPRDRFRFRGFCCLWRRVLLLVVPLVFRAPSDPAALMGRAAVCAGGRRSAREPSAPRVVACGAAGVLGAVGPGRPRDRHTRASLGVVDLEARPCPPGPPAPSTPAALVVLCAPAANWAVTALLSPGLVPLDAEAFDDLCTRERGQDLARYEQLRSAQARADAAPSDRARRVDEEPP